MTSVENAGQRPDLVTGATGFIGRHLAERLLADGRAVRVLCREESLAKLSPRIAREAEVARGDLRDPASLRQAVAGANRVFHCAGQVSDWGADADFDATNVVGTRHLLEAAQAARVRRFVHLSSIAVFGIPSPESFDDETPFGPGRDPYSRTKIAGELQVRDFPALPWTILRPAVVYGRYGTWVEEPLRMIRAGKMFLLGGGHGTCHPCYIENLLDAILLAAEDPRAIGRAYIVADDNPISFREYFDQLARLAGSAPIRRSIPLPVARAMATVFESAARVADWAGSRSRPPGRPLLTHAAIDMVCTPSRLSMRRIREELGYTPQYSFARAMDELSGSMR